jgi:hypothetical protein
LAAAIGRQTCKPLNELNATADCLSNPVSLLIQGAIGEEICMNSRLLLLIVSLCPALTMAQGCDVITRSQSPSVPVIESHTCYEYENMPVDAIDWSCSNESKEMLSSTKKKVAQCADRYQATCVGRLTPESLANPQSTSKDKNSKAPNIPENAQVSTYYYNAENLAQSKIDCETGGGSWKTK